MRSQNTEVRIIKMKMLKNYAVILILFLSQTGFAQKIPDCKLANEYIEQLISKKAEELQGVEYCQYRHYNSLDDLDNDGVDDFILVFSVEGALGNAGNSIEFMMVFLSTIKVSSPLETQIGNRGKVTFDDFVNVSNNIIELELLVWRENDALCCPSGKGKAIYQIKDKQIIKIE